MIKKEKRKSSYFDIWFSSVYVAKNIKGWIKIFISYLAYGMIIINLATNKKFLNKKHTAGEILFTVYNLMSVWDQRVH
jgi:hypothetical protein